MNARIWTALVGVVTLLLGLAGLVYPVRVMGMLGFMNDDAAHLAAVLGEMRATYGGIFIVLGVATLLAAADPPAHRNRVLFIGLLWVGAFAGRLFGVYVDGNPGLIGWGSAGFELVMGGALLLSAQSRGPAEVAAAPPLPPVAAAHP